MHYKVLETQDYTEPIEEWSVVFHVTDESHAYELMSKHYNTQIADEENYNPVTDCDCGDCALGFRAIDWQGLTMQVQAIDGDICPDCLNSVSWNESRETWLHDERPEGCYLAFTNEGMK